jgi:Uma2 family endonuclease
MASPVLLDAEPETQVELPEPLETDEALYEVVHGERVEMPRMSIRAAMIAADLVAELNVFVRSNPLGRVFPETAFRLALPEDLTRERRPEIAFVSNENWPAESPRNPDANAWEVVPDLAVEVTSPTDRAEDQLEKILEYFQAGIREVGVVYPRLKMVDVYESPSCIVVLTEADTLRGDPVLPGFEIPLARIIQDTCPRFRNRLETLQFGRC